MKKLHILLVTRNRLVGLIDALASICRLVGLARNNVSIQVVIQDNSDVSMPIEVIRYFSGKVPIQYYKTTNVLPMSANWNEGLERSLTFQPDYIAVLADRRLVTANLLNAVQHLEELNQPFICFDHQDAWINSQMVRSRKYSYLLQGFSRDNLLAAIGSAHINWHYPMLFNCLIRSDFLHELASRYGSMAEGSSPDMNFLARIADIGIQGYFTYESPCIVTNARHAASSNGSSALRAGLIYDTEHTRLSGVEAFPGYMQNFVTANITGSLARYWSNSKMMNLIDPIGFFKNSLLELSYPKSKQAFSEMKKSLREFCLSFSLGQSMVNALDEVQHSPASSQIYPICAASDISNFPNLNLLASIEYR
jgi:hypothetical protein